MPGRLRRYLRLPEFRLLFYGMVLIALSISAVSTFSDRIERAMQERTSALLGADAQISSTRPLDPDYTEMAKDYGLEIAQTVSFMSMVVTGSESRLAGVRAVSSSYPLRGEVILEDSDAVTGMVSVTAAPAPGTIWAATQIVKDLGLASGTTLGLGDQDFSYSGEILLEPEGGAGMLRLAPRVVINIADLDSTGLITPASRARFRLLLAGSEENLNRFNQFITPKLKEYESWRKADLRQEEVRNTFGRIISYVRLGVLLSVALAIVAMGLAAQGLWGRQINEVALMRCLGQKNRRTLHSIFTVYASMALPATLAGVMIGYGLQSLAARAVTALAGIRFPEPSIAPILISILITLVTLFAVVAPITLSIKSIPSVTLLRGGQTDNIRKNRTALLSILGLLVVVTLFLARDLVLGFSVLAGLVLAAVLLWSIILAMIVAIRKLIPPAPKSWFVALKSLSSNGSRSAWIASTFGAIMFALVLLAVIRNDVFEAWEQTLPDDAPNLFLMNITESNIPSLQQILDQNEQPDTTLYKIIRGRVISINDVPLSDMTFESRESRHRANHEYNLTELSSLPQDNEIVQGSWSTQGETGFSIEQETAEVLGVKPGDVLTIDVAGQDYSGPVTSVRTVKWDNMRPNFFIIATPGLFDGAPRNYITGIHVPSERSELINKINQSLPNVTAIDLGMMLERLRNLTDQGAGAISVVFIFTFAAAILVFSGILQGQRESRKREIALMKTLGANRQFIRSTIVHEFALLGVVAGIVGSLLALLSSWLLARNLFEFSMAIPWQWLFVGIVTGTVVVSSFGYLSIRKLLREYPSRLLSGK